MLLAALGTNIGFAGKPGGGGKGGKVTVELATPNSVIQTNEEDVTIVGTGFDNGSSVRFLVTGTTDDTQIEVVGPATFISSTELKVHIKTNGSTATVDYDVEVQATSGRKGKGTTLFKVQQVETACSGFESKEPSIAFLTGADTNGEIETKDLYLSSESGCDQYLLAEDVVQYMPEGRIWIKMVTWLRLSVRDNVGVVTWIGGSETTNSIMGLLFEFDSNGNIFPDPAGPSQFYAPPEGLYNWHADVRINANGEIELVIYDRPKPYGTGRQLSVYNVNTSTRDLLLSGNCPITDDTADCYEVMQGIYWNRYGDEIYFRVKNSFTTNDKWSVARISLLNGVWGPPELVMIPEALISLEIQDVSLDGVMLYQLYSSVTNKRGKITGERRTLGTLDLAVCGVLNPCSLSEGTDLPALIKFHFIAWTANGSVLVVNSGQNNNFIQEYSNPYTGTVGGLRIDDTGYEFDTAK